MHPTIYSPYRGLFPLIFPLITGLSSPVHAQPDLRITEFVVDPQYDWNQDGAITPSDEWFEICNRGNEPASLHGIELRLVDTTPTGLALTNFISLAPSERLVIIDPEGMQNNNGRIELWDVVNQRLVDGCSYGTWPDNIWNMPNGNATGMHNESLSRYSENSNTFVKTYATPNAPNVPSPSALLLGGLGIGYSATRRRR